jgi:hypothetical protein
VPTAPSWTETWAEARTEARTGTWPAAAADAGSLLRFRLAGLRGRSRRAAPVALLVLSAITLAAAVLPALVPEGDLSRAEALDLLPVGFLGLLVVSVVSTASSGGGRELLPREQAVAFPVDPVTDHLGALLLAPLNIAWLLQCWALLGAASYAVGPRAAVVAAVVAVLAWLVTATALAQVLAWGVEWVRRGPHGSLVVRGLGGLLLGVGAVVVATGRADRVLAGSPTRYAARGVDAAASGQWLHWTAVLLVLGATTCVAVVAGGRLAVRVARRPAREENRGETAVRPARPHPGSDLLALVRVDRAGIWRSVPMRRGMAVLALFPGLVAVGGSFRWETLAVFPGLVASGGALLFGVNAWCLDGRGALWRDSLPVAPRLGFCSRVLVLTEILLASAALALAVASLRAGVPTPDQLVPVLCSAVVVSVQVVATALRWSVRHPYAVDLRSARATPAPPLVMVGYSARLALSTTCTGLVFSTLSATSWWWSPVAAVPFLAWSGVKLHRTARAWGDAPTRARVVAVVAG